MVDDQYRDIRRYRFGTAAFDETRLELTVDGRIVAIEPLPAKFLQQLLRHAGALVPYEHFRSVVWGGADIAYDAITMAKRRIVQCLGPTNGARIVARPKLGYCLTGRVECEVIGVRVEGQALVRSEPPAAGGDERTRAFLKFITDSLIDAANPAVTGRTRNDVVEAARAAGGRIDTSFGADDAPDIRATLHREMQGLFSQLSEIGLAVIHGRAALAAAVACQSADPRQLADIQLALAEDLVQLSALDEAGALIKAVDRLLGEAGLRHSALQARLLHLRGTHAIGTLATRDAVAYLDQAWALTETLPDRSPDLQEQIAFELANACWLAADFARAEVTARRLMASQIERFGRQSARAAYSAVLLANVLAFADRCEEAITILEPAIETLSETLGPDSRRTVTARGVLANIAFKQGEYGKAAAIWSGLKAHFTRHTGPTSLNALVNDNNIAIALQRDGQQAEAEQIIRETLRQARATFGDDQPLTQLLRYELASRVLDLGQAEEAAPLLAGLDPAKLKEAKIQDDWPAVLLYEEARIVLAGGDRAGAITRLAEAADQLAKSECGGPLSEAFVRALIRQIEREHA